jgi:hypothetical protein
MTNQEKKIEKLLKLINTDKLISSSELEQFGIAVLKVITDAKKNLTELSDENISKIQGALTFVEETYPQLIENVTSVKEKIDTSITDLHTVVSKAKEDFYNTVEEIHTELDKIKAIKVQPAKNGETPSDEKLISLITPLIPEPLDGETPTDEKLISLIEPLIPDPILPLSGIEIRDELEALKEDDKLSITAIKNYSRIALQENVDRALSILDQRTQFLINKQVQSSSGISGSGTANQLTYWVNSTTLGSLTTATYPSLTELSYVKGVTSSIQTQLNSKLSSAIISLNGLTGATQTFAGSGISISSVGTTHTFTNTGVTSLNSPTTNITVSASTGAVDIDVNQGSGYTWTGDHIFTSNIDFTPTDSTSQFFDMNVDTNASVPSVLRFWNNGGIMSSLEINVDQGKDIRYLLPKDQPTTGQILYVVDWTDPIATLGFTSASGDVIGPGTAVTSGEMTVFDTDTTHIKGVTSITAGNFATIGSNSVFYPNENVLSVGTVSSTYSGSFASSTNGANGLWIYNGNTGTSKVTQLILQSASTTGGDVWGTLRAYPSNYTTGALASRFVIQAGTSQQMTFEVDSNYEWRKSTTPVAKLTTTGFLSGNGSPLAQLHSLQGTLGNDVLRIESVASGDDVRQSTYQNRVATTTNTQTTIHTFTLATTTTYLIEARVTARRTGGSAGTAEDSAGYVIRGTYKNVAGTATLVGTLDTPYTAEDQAGWDATFTVTGATVLCRVTGATNTNITWHMTATVNQLTS